MLVPKPVCANYKVRLKELYGKHIYVPIYGHLRKKYDMNNRTFLSKIVYFFSSGKDVLDGNIVLAIEKCLKP
jgi:hypothetical protein